MAWTPPKTWTPGDVLTAADLNTYVRDNESSGRPRCHVSRRSTQTANNNTDTSVLFDTQVVDTDSFWDSGVSGGGVITAPYDGDYDVSYRLTFFAHADGGWRRGVLWKNGSSAFMYGWAQDQPDAASSAQAITVTARDIITLAAGDTLQLVANHNAGVAISVGGSSTQDQTVLTAVYLGA